jgi:zinc protease
MSVGPASLPPPPSQVLVETSRALPLVSVSLAFRWGAFMDPIGREGMTRLLVRLMRRTAGGRGAEAVDVLVDTLGASLSAEVSHGTATFQGVVIERSFDRFMALLADVLLRPGLERAELERLVRETESELLEVLDNDSALARRWFRRRLFAGHPFARPVMGYPRSIKALDLDGARALLERGLQREDCVFAFSGDIDEDRANRAAEGILGSVPSGTRTVDPTPEPAGLGGRRLVIVDKPERTQTQILMGGLGTHPRDADHVPLHVASTIFGGTFTSRLMKEIRADRGWSYGAYASLPIDRRRQAFSLWTFPSSDDAPACIAHQLGMLERLIEEGITDEELEHAKNYLVRSHAFAIDTAAKRVGLALDEELLDLPEGYYEDYTRRVSSVTRDAVHAAIRNRLSAENLLVVVVGTESTIGTALRAAIPNLASVEVVPYDAEE